jgi:hypothetical protein
MSHWDKRMLIASAMMIVGIGMGIYSALTRDFSGLVAGVWLEVYAVCIAWDANRSGTDES